MLREAIGQGVDDAPTFASLDLAKAQDELNIHISASRAILLHLCQRLARVESSQRAIQNDLFRIRGDVSKGTTEIRGEVSVIQDQVQSLSSRLSDVASVVDSFQNEINNQKTNVTNLSVSVEDERVRLTAVDVKVDNQRDEFDTRIQELNLRLDEIPRALAALQKTGGRDPFAGFTFRAADRDKLSLGKHIDRSVAGGKPGGPPFTDLQPFTIPADMKEKIEMKIRLKESSKLEEDKRAASELADAYRRLQLAGYPRVTEIYMHVEQCRSEIKRAFDCIRESNLQLFACCESKGERMDIVSLQKEVRALRDKFREYDARVGGKMAHSTANAQAANRKHLCDFPSAAVWNLDKYFNAPLGDGLQNDTSLGITAAQVPELRLSLLEMSRNLHVLQQQWAKRHIQPIHPVAKQHLQTLSALLNDGYSATAKEPVDLRRVESYVEKIARLLASEYSQQILTLLVPNETLCTETSGEETIAAIDRYAQALTDAIAARFKDGDRLKTGHQVSVLVLQEQKESIEQVQNELAKVVESQRSMMAAIANRAESGLIPVTSAEHDCASDIRFATQQQQLYGLQDQLSVLHRHSLQQEEAFAELSRQFAVFKKERTPIGMITGQRLTAASPATHSVQHGSPLTAALRRTHSIVMNPDLDAYLAITAIDQSDRPKSQAKLDPLQVDRGAVDFQMHSSRSPSSGKVALPEPVTRNGALHKIQNRAQALRPKSGVHHNGVNS